MEYNCFDFLSSEANWSILNGNKFKLKVDAKYKIKWMNEKTIKNTAINIFVVFVQLSSKNGLTAYLFSLNADLSDTSIIGSENERKIERKQNENEIQMNWFSVKISEKNVELDLIFNLN